MKSSIVLLVLCLAQTLPAFQHFEVATIKPNSESDNRVGIQIQPGGRFLMTGASLKMMITFAYDLKDFQVTGEPGWANADKWDLNAKGEGVGGDRPQPDIFRKMLRELLEDRFQLKTHEETKEMPIYWLVPAKGGPKLKASETSPGPRIRIGRGGLSGNGFTMDILSKQVSRIVGRDVIDKTDLKGNYDLELNYSAEAVPGGGGGAPPSADALAAAGSNGPTIFTALQEQLGLKLDPQKGPVKVLVIDKVMKPTEN